MASGAASSSGAVVPARLGFLAIYNPSLGRTDETMDEQIVYYASVTTQAASSHRRRRRRVRARARPTDGLTPQERHERLRQIGLAQGMVSFGRGFADGAAVDAIDTDGARVVVHELEPGWWILASIDLTKMPLPPRLVNSAAEDSRFEYSSREMKPASLLVGDLLRAHNIFLMHHGSSLSGLFVHCRRSKFVALLGRYWDLFLSTWNVLLHGNPARDMFGAINVAASGELGVGVGEEDRGSGEREVLEGLVGRIEGLVDLVVSKFGTDEDESEQDVSWLGTGREPAADDGAVFLGVGALSRKSLRDVTHWMEDLYTWGEHAYGVIESPTSVRRAGARCGSAAAHEDGAATEEPSAGAEDKAPVESAESKAAASEQPAESKAAASEQPAESKAAASEQPAESKAAASEQPAESKTAASKPAGQADGRQWTKNAVAAADDGRLDKMLSYMKLGYGSYWTLPGATSQGTASRQPSSSRRPAPPKRTSSAGRFLIGLTGQMEETDDDGDAASSGCSEAEHNSRTVLRTVHVELESDGTRPEMTMVKDFVNPVSERQVAYSSYDVNKTDKLRVVIYVNRPFVFAFFFRLRTDSLAWDTLYRSLHYQLAPLRRPLLASTRYRPPSSQPPGGLYSLVWDPASLTVRAAVPNIPDQQQLRLGGGHSSLLDAFWSRADAVSTHLQLLLLQAATRSVTGTVERTLKTSRGWWIVWTRLGHGDDDDDDDDDDDCSASGPGLPAKEIFLIRRASDHAGAADAVAAAGLVQGIGVDTRRYVEELLSLL